MEIRGSSIRRLQPDDISIARQMKGAMEPMGEADGIYIIYILIDVTSFIR